MKTTSTTAKALERRIAEHRREVARLRERYGDPEEALSAYVRDHFDRDALASALDEQLGRPGVWWEDEVDDERGG